MSIFVLKVLLLSKKIHSGESQNVNEELFPPEFFVGMFLRIESVFHDIEDLIKR